MHMMLVKVGERACTGDIGHVSMFPPEYKYSSDGQGDSVQQETLFSTTHLKI